MIYAGLEGTEAPDRNFSVTFVFYTVWIGIPILSVFFGDFFRAFNPWRAIARVVGAIFALIAGPVGAAAAALPGMARPLAGGDRRARASAGSSSSTRRAAFRSCPGLTPHTVAVAALVYTAYTFVAMTLFGSERWLDRGEAFSVYFGMFASLAPLEVRDGRLGVRRALAAASSLGQRAGLDRADPGRRSRSPPSTAPPKGFLSSPIDTVNGWVGDLGLGPVDSLRVTYTLFLGARGRLRLRALLGRDLRHAHGPRRARARAGSASCSRTPSSRSRSPTWSPTTSAPCSTSSRRSSATCSPIRSATARTCSAPRAAGSTTRRWARRGSGTCRSRRW